MREDTISSQDISATEHRYVHPLSAGASERNAIPGYDWRNESTYAFPGKVGFASWLAWEALRRNVLFQRFCEMHDPADDASWGDEPDPSDWGLAKFKHYRESIDPHNASSWPDWQALRPTKLVELIAPAEVRKPGSKRTQMVSPNANSRTIVTLNQGQVALVFDIEKIKHSKPMLDKQIEHAREELHKLAQLLRASSKVETPHEDSVIPLLRIADD